MKPSPMRRRTWIWVTGVALLVSFGCTSSHEGESADGDAVLRSRAHAVYPSIVVEQQGEPIECPPVESGDFDFQARGPIEFLEFLVARYERMSAAGVDEASPFGLVYTVVGTHRGWIQVQDIEALVGRLDSMRPCAPVVKAISSFLPSGPSTEGHEAALLIQAYREDQESVRYGGFPAVLSSPGAAVDTQELRDWWATDPIPR